MSKLNRIICCLILPMLAMVCFAGCEKDKTKADIDNKLSAIRAEYIIEDAENNEMFDKEHNLINISYLGSEMNKISSLNIDNFSNDKNAYNRYKALINVQHKIVNTTLLYYAGMSEEFYSRMELTGVKTDELNEIYNNLESLEEALKTFKVAKDKLEQTVDVLTFEGVVRADLTSYSYSLNLLIEECMNFTDYFIKLNEKYLFSGEITESNKELYAKHYLFEAVNELNEVIYYRYVKAFNNVNECDLSKLLAEGGSCGYEADYLFGSDKLKDVAEKMMTGNKAINVAITVEAVEDFREVRDSFAQKFEVYKTVYGRMDYYRYMSQIALDTLEGYKESVGSVETANINLVENFYTTTLKNYYSDAFWSQI